VYLEYTGKRGRPKKCVDPVYLEEAFSASRKLSKMRVSRGLKIGRHTLRARLKENNISTSFSLISDADLDNLVREFRLDHPNSGIQYLHAHLRVRIGRIQRKRVVDSTHRVDGVGCHVRKSRTIKRRVYTVVRPNAMWHMDGHHKLITWGIVVHAMVDGFCRTVCIPTLLSYSQA
jgi:hypothetical protein